MVKLDWLTDEAVRFLKEDEGYLSKGETAEDRYLGICRAISFYCKENSKGMPIDSSYNTEDIYSRFIEYISKGWVSFSSPVLANFGKTKGLPISCNHGKIDDTLESIEYQRFEMAMLAKNGAGTAKNFSNIRAKGSPISTGGKSDGVMSWIEDYAFGISKVTQGSVRRGFLTAYLSLAHGEIFDFLEIGTKAFKDKCDYQFMNSITTAVTIPEGWMDKLKEGSPEHRKIWSKLLKTRNEAGFPYILFEDNCNKNSPQVYRDKNLWIDSSNICIEAMEYTDSEKEFACCLSSVNLVHFDEWKNNKFFVKDMSIMLDCVIEEYIRKGSKLMGLERAVKFAKEHRATGLGVLGFHSYLQSKMIPIGSLESFSINNKIFSHIRRECDEVSSWMANSWGEPKMMEGYGLRNSSRIAIAPTKSTAFIMGSISQSVEPIKSNYNEKILSKFQSTYKNPELVKLLDSKGKNDDKTWSSVLENNGSVQHLSFLSQDEKDVFKTFPEISQVDLIKLAASRQKFIDMGQSLNLMIHPETSPKDENKLILMAHELGIKSLYYRYSISASQEFNKSLLECSSCDG